METPFSLVYGSDAMIPVEIHESTPRFQSFVAEESNEERRVNLDLLDEAREEARIKAEAVKRRVDDGDQAQEEIEAKDQGQKEVEEAQGDTTLPQRLTRSKFKELGSSGRLFSLFIVSLI